MEEEQHKCMLLMKSKYQKMSKETFNPLFQYYWEIQDYLLSHDTGFIKIKMNFTEPKKVMATIHDHILEANST